MEHPDARTAFQLAVGVVCFCRFYYYVLHVPNSRTHILLRRPRDYTAQASS